MIPAVWVYCICYPFLHFGSSGCFCLLAVVNNAANSLGVKISGDSISFGYIPQSRSAGLYGHSFLNFFKNCRTGFHSGCTISFPPRVHKGSNFPTAWATAVIFCFGFFVCLFGSIEAILMGCEDLSRLGLGL